MKNVIEVIKNIFSDKRKRSGLGVIVCVLFMFLMVLLVKPQAETYKSYYSSNKTSNIPKVNSKDVIDGYNNITSYEISYDINITENNINKTYNVQGTYFDDKYYLLFDNKSYYLVNDKIYLVDDINNKLLSIDIKDKNSIFNKIDFNLLLKKNTYNIIKSSEEKSKTEYKDGTVTIEYLYKNYKEKTINVIIKANNNLINHIDYDLTNYFDNNIYQSFKVNSTYTNVNNIADYNKSYEGYTIVDNTTVVSNSNVVSNNTEANK